MSVAPKDLPEQPAQAVAHTHSDGAPSDWIVRFAPLVAPGGRALDLACGHGRHARVLADLGVEVLAVDRDAALAADFVGLPDVRFVPMDLEGAAWPLAGEAFDAIVVTNYLHRPHLDALVQALAPGGLLLVETFAHGNAAFGRPSNPDFLLQPGELLALAARSGLRVLAFEDGYVSLPRPACMQRLAALRIAPGAPVDAGQIQLAPS